MNIDDAKRSECSHHVNGECGLCSTEAMIDSYRDFLKYFEQKTDDVIKNTKKYLDVKRESHIWEHPLFKAWYGDGTAEVLSKMFKPKGPAYGTNLLNNFNIDETLAGWADLGEELFDKKIKHYSYQMIDFAHNGGDLNNLNIKDLVSHGYSAFVCVLNTDVSSGRGKHWFCIYGDTAHSGVTGDPIVIEFFNSSGNMPREPVAIFVKKIIDDAKPMVVKYKRALKKRIQFSNTECGVWCLTYIKCRLQDKTPEWFEDKMTDAGVTNYRKHLFRD